MTSTTPDSAAAPTGADATDIGYGQAMAELDAILAELDDDGIDIDVLSERVERAAWLISLCRGRIAAAHTRVADIVDALEPADDEPAT